MSAHQEQNEAIKDQFGKQAARYAQLPSAGKNAQLERLVAAVRPGPDDEVLDVGCGPGRLTLALAGLVRRATGIDLTPEMLAQARALQTASGIQNTEWLEGDILPLPFEGGAFSLVTTQATFHHLADPAGVLAEMVRVCRPGGRLAVIDLTPDPAKAAAFDQVERLRDPSHVRVLSVEEIRCFGRAAGLEELAVQSYLTPIPAEAVLATSAPGPEIVAQVRAIYREDAASGANRLGMSLREEGGAIWAAYPMTLFAWRRL